MLRSRTIQKVEGDREAAEGGTTDFEVRCVEKVIYWVKAGVSLDLIYRSLF